MLPLHHARKKGAHPNLPKGKAFEDPNYLKNFYFIKSKVPKATNQRYFVYFKAVTKSLFGGKGAVFI